MKEKEKKDAVLLLRLSKALLAAIDRAAEKDDRERSDWIRKTLKKRVSEMS
jgi:metal-responsive CopG/Arc/MetJ family transcriptional regulator